jgi:DNA-binding helix-hairpin-helix protein with protein kinase domain
VSVGQEPDAEANDEWTPAIHQAILDMEEAVVRREAEREALAQANAVIAQATWDALTPEEKEALEAEREAEGEREHQAYLEEQAEAELFDRLEAEISEPEIGD